MGGCEGGGWRLFWETPLESCDCDCGWDWVFGCVDDAVGGLALAPPDAVVGGVDMPFGASAAGEAMVVIVALMLMVN